jgi:hypothetical protein
LILVSHLHMAAAHELLLIIEFLLPLHHLLLERTRSIARVISERCSLSHLSTLIDLGETWSAHVNFAAKLISLLHTGIVPLIKEDTSVLSVLLLVRLHLLRVLLLRLDVLLLAELSFYLPFLILR